MEKCDPVLELLYDRRDGFFILDELAAAASLNRRQLDECLHLLRERGYELETAPAQGVRLVRPVKLNAYLLEHDLGTSRVGRHVLCFDEVDSTNDVAMDSARQRNADGLVVLAESQRSGRGRHGRTWQSRPGDSALLSALLLTGEGSPLSHEALTIAAGLAVAEGIDAACEIPCSVKWPNDVLLEGRKVAGVLVETRPHRSAQAIVVGIGINVNSSPPDGLVFPATDLASHAGESVDRIEVVRSVLRRLDAWVAQLADGRTDELHDAWIARCGMINERITVVCGGREFVGRVLDVSPMAGLILACDDGRRVDLPARSSTIVK